MNLPKRSLLTLGVAFVLGCASMPEPLESQAAPPPSKGVLIAEVSSDGHAQTNDVWFYVRRKGSSDEIRLDAFGLSGLLKKQNHLDGVPGRMGRLVAIPLEPGEYELFNWTLYVYRLGGYGYISPKQPPPVHTFQIQPGKSTYLGALHVDSVLGKNPFGISMVFGGRPNLSDQWVRDEAILKARYPGIAAWPVAMAIPDPKGWQLQD